MGTSERVAFTVVVDWLPGEDPDIVVRRAGYSQSDREAIAYALRLAAAWIAAEDAVIAELS